MAPADAPAVRFAAVLVMAGSGERFGADVPKALVDLDGRPLWEHAAATLRSVTGCAALVLVVPPDHEEALRAAAARFPGAVVVAGGERRQDSVRHGLVATPEDVDVVAVHDAARPLIRAETVRAATSAAARHGAALAAAPVHDTIKCVDAAGRVTETPDRSALWHAQTPQCFRRELLLRAHEAAARDAIDATDDAMLVERLGVAVHVVAADRWNLKITVPDDLRVAEALLRARRAGPHD